MVKSCISYMGVVALVTAIALLTFSVSVRSDTNTRENFTVNEAGGSKTFKLSDAKGKYVALHFLLKTTCGYCLRYTQEYAARASEVPGTVQIFLKPDTEDEIEAWKTKYNDSISKTAGVDNVVLPVIYRDPDAKLAKAFNIPDGYKFHDQIVHYPSLVILGPEGKEFFRYIGKNNGDRFAFDLFAAMMTNRTQK